MDLLLAELNRACIYTVPKHITYSKVLNHKFLRFICFVSTFFPCMCFDFSMMASFSENLLHDSSTNWQMGCNRYLLKKVRLIPVSSSVFVMWILTLFLLLQTLFGTKEAYRQAIGYKEEDGVLESEEKYVKRVDSCMRLYGALVQVCPSAEFYYNRYLQ